eukprot:351580-Chlamydomonas_euryale.AAC.2
MTIFGRVGGSTSVCERSTSVRAAGRRRSHLRPVTGHWVNGERWVPFTVQRKETQTLVALGLAGLLAGGREPEADWATAGNRLAVGNRTG